MQARGSCSALGSSPIKQDLPTCPSRVVMASLCAEGEGYPEFTLVLLTCSDAAPRGLVQGPPSTPLQVLPTETTEQGRRPGLSMMFPWLHFIKHCSYFSATRLGHFSARRVTGWQRVVTGGSVAQGCMQSLCFLTALVQVRKWGRNGSVKGNVAGRCAMRAPWNVFLET